MVRKGVSFKLCGPGSHINGTGIFGIRTKLQYSLVATETCHILLISRAKFEQVLTRRPSAQLLAPDLRKEEVASHDAMLQYFKDFNRRRAHQKIITAALVGPVINLGAN